MKRPPLEWQLRMLANFIVCEGWVEDPRLSGMKSVSIYDVKPNETMQFKTPRQLTMAEVHSIIAKGYEKYHGSTDLFKSE